MTNLQTATSAGQMRAMSIVFEKCGIAERRARDLGAMVDRHLSGRINLCRAQVYFTIYCD
jgi:hypothetical protein